MKTKTKAQSRTGKQIVDKTIKNTGLKKARLRRVKELRNKKIFFTLVAVFILLSVGVIAFRIYSSPLHFAYYEPSYLPPGVSITEKRISIVDDGKNRHERADLRMEKTAWTYSISQFERKINTTIGEANGDYDAKSVKPTCSIFQTFKGTEYRLCHWVDDWTSHGGGQVSVYEVKFIKGSTYFWGRIPSEVGTVISVDDVSNFIDSFEQKSIDGVPIKQSRYWV